ncbi:GNAT family N-acetyltransferase [Paracoccus aminovorans]|uniref:GNAT family N-acetyltransferase n=1 Tax=Paracoccus aminovorans TaxID=34004 RepID=UPI002B263C63|nr:GNAT family N-acetyltransferase [Paracoccus aminovorans]
MSGPVIRELDGLAELKRSEDLQRTVWGPDDPADNADLMLAIQHEGGLVAGAFDGAHMLGFLFAFPSATPGVQHSHRLAVLPQARGLRLGLRLKWFQRDWCLARGIRHVRWTYDPLRAVNAGLNVGALGGVSDTYLPDYYGAMPGINAGLPSDRLLLDWPLDSPGVAARAAGLAPPETAVAQRVPIPRDLDALRREAPEAALQARLALRDVLTAGFAGGLRIIGFDTQACAYLLG